MNGIHLLNKILKTKVRILALFFLMFFVVFTSCAKESKNSSFIKTQLSEQDRKKNDELCKIASTPPAHNSEIEFEISNWRQLMLISSDTLGWSAHYVLVQDIEFPYANTCKEYPDYGNEGFKPIGNKDKKFSGKFNGKNFSIKNFYINRPSQDNVGLFGVTDKAEIQALNIETIGISGKDKVGTLAGALNTSSISNISIRSISKAKVIGKDEVGGLIGNGFDSKAENLSSDLSVLGSNYVGGLIGNCDHGSFSGKNTGLEVIGNLNSDNKSDSVGGLAGLNSNCEIQGSSSARVVGVSNVGGLVGTNGLDDDYGNISILIGYSSGDVRGKDNVGGLVGSSLRYAKIVGYATGNVEGTTLVGGLVGYNDRGLISGYSLGQVSAEDSAGGLIGETFDLESIYGQTSIQGYTLSKLVRRDPNNSNYGIFMYYDNWNEVNSDNDYKTGFAWFYDKNLKFDNHVDIQSKSFDTKNLKKDSFKGLSFGTELGQWTWVQDGALPAINLDDIIAAKDQPIYLKK